MSETHLGPFPKRLGGYHLELLPGYLPCGHRAETTIAGSKASDKGKSIKFIRAMSKQLFCSTAGTEEAKKTC